MFLKSKESEDLIKVIELEELFDPTKNAVSGKSQAGQEEQDPQHYEKEKLIFPSGESLPLCWLDANYKHA